MIQSLYHFPNDNSMIFYEYLLGFKMENVSIPTSRGNKSFLITFSTVNDKKFADEFYQLCQRNNRL
jgi:hypothetical protein